MNLLASQLRKWRVARGLSQQVLAEQAGIPRPNLIDLELGRRDCTITTLVKLARALGLSAGALLDEEPKEVEARASHLRLNRHQRDAVARFILSGKGRLGKAARRLAEDLAPLLRPTFEANGIPVQIKKVGRLRRRRYHLEMYYPRDLIEDICERVRKMIPLFAGVERIHG